MRGEILSRLESAMAARQIAGAPALAKICNLKESTARAYVNGTRTPSLEACQKIGPRLGVSGNWLYYGREPREAPIEIQSTPSELIFVAVEEAFLQAGISPPAAAEIASVVELALRTLRAPAGMTPETALRRIIRWEVPDILKRKQ